ncbi:non-specific lipid-transfer protein 1 [Elaeis guineensis]|uniref:Non-specific lipid-transfer protein n=1 Tax=Elaeis guineensis var. tenera TaxID=51953 RepID=A0A1D5AIU8_ELAGV|nr:non-specific lipid-transfer protein 1 [Elaeis guineensis]AOC88973.1 type 1 nonspecific lipid transfer protein LTP107 [Elaeis guineensis]
MARSGALLALAAVLAVLLVSAPHAANAITCGQVASSVSGCISYVRSGGSIPASCCSGVRSLAGSAKTTADRRTVCNCLKSTAARISGIKPALAAGLPSKCGVRIPFTISPSTDCSKVT